MSCPYCFADSYFKENSFEDKCRIIDKLYKIGIEYIDFFGKEPLLDDTLFRLCDYMESTNRHFHISLITNGKNLKKYKQDVINCTFIEQVTVSYDFGVTRTFNIDPLILKEFETRGIITELTIDLQKRNINNVLDIIKARYSNNVFLNPIVPQGSNKTSAKEVMVSLSDLRCLINRLQKEVSDKTSSVYVKVPFELSTGFNIETQNEHVTVEFEPVCTCGIDHLFIASNGYVYGCNSPAYNHSEKCCDFLKTPIEEIKKIIQYRGGIRECLKF